MKIFSRFNWKRLIDGEEFPFLPPPVKKKQAGFKKK